MGAGVAAGVKLDVRVVARREARGARHVERDARVVARREARGARRDERDARVVVALLDVSVGVEGLDLGVVEGVRARLALRVRGPCSSRVRRSPPHDVLRRSALTRSGLVLVGGLVRHGVVPTWGS